MALSLPAGFETLAEAKQGSVGEFHDVIGVVIDTRSPMRTRTNETTCEFTLIDVSYPAGCRIRYFCKDEAFVPKVELGDVVCVRSVKTITFAGSTIWVSNFSTQTIVFSRDAIPSRSYSVAYAGGKTSIAYKSIPPSIRPSIEEQMYAIDLVVEMAKQAHTRSALQAPTKVKEPQKPVQAEPAQAEAQTRAQNAAAPRPPARMPLSNKFRLLKDTGHNHFIDTVVEVVKIFPNRYGDFCEVYMTDYTSNEGFFSYLDPKDAELAAARRDGDEYDYLLPSRRELEWPGPWGQRTIKVEVYAPHMHFISERVREGDIIMLKNLRVKSGNAGKLEGNLWRDNRYPESLGVSKPDLGLFEAQELIERKKHYWDARKARHDPDQPKTKKLSAKAKKNKKKQKAEEAAAKDLAELNENIQCGTDSIAFSTLRDLLAERGETKDGQALPFINQKRRAKVQAVDFFPSNLHEFSQWRDVPYDHPKDSPDADDMDCSRTDWCWSFFLLLQDVTAGSGATCWVHVSDEPAQALLGLKAGNLMVEETKLHKLREQLFLLWGNLAEIKGGIDDMAAGAQATDDQTGLDRWGGQLCNRPFECCISEYGQELDQSDREGDQAADGWVRLFSMSDTVIK